jgi:hypothetical protein
VFVCTYVRYVEMIVLAPPQSTRIMWRLKGGVENGKGFDTHANCLGAGFLFAC